MLALLRFLHPPSPVKTSPKVTVILGRAPSERCKCAEILLLLLLTLFASRYRHNWLISGAHRNGDEAPVASSDDADDEMATTATTVVTATTERR